MENSHEMIYLKKKKNIFKELGKNLSIEKSIKLIYFFFLENPIL